MSSGRGPHRSGLPCPRPRPRPWAPTLCGPHCMLGGGATMATTALRYGNHIDGEWVDAARTHENRNPANGELIGEFAESSVEDADRAVAAASAAYESWRLYPAPKRAELLFRVAELI